MTSSAVMLIVSLCAHIMLSEGIYTFHRDHCLELVVATLLPAMFQVMMRSLIALTLYCRFPPWRYILWPVKHGLLSHYCFSQPGEHHATKCCQLYWDTFRILLCSVQFMLKFSILRDPISQQCTFPLTLGKKKFKSIMLTFSDSLILFQSNPGITLPFLI